MLSATELLGEGGPFATRLTGFAPRAQQQEMAVAVEEAIARSSTTVVEAGTGTGKTLAYLVPALLCGKKVIVSTGTRTLQDQLFQKDLPLVREALNVPVQLALLKGRANYLCPHRLDLALSEGRFRSRQMIAQLQEISRWGNRTLSGDLAELDHLPENAEVFLSITSSADNCLGQECERIDDCFLAKARRKAQQADLVVVNHYLLLADMALRDEGFGELLPGANVFILDEAHQIPEIASNFFGIAASSNQLIELARDTIAEDLKEGGELKEVQETADRLEKAARDLRLALGEALRRAPWNEVRELPPVQAGVAELVDAVGALHTWLEPLAPRSKGLEAVHRRAGELTARFEQLTGDTPEGYIHWFENFSRSFSLNLTPIDVGTQFSRHMASKAAAWVFTSATLAVDGNFDHFCRRLGIETYEGHCFDSPFDYPQQGLFYVPRGLPDPSEAGYTRAVVEYALPVLEASDGRAFLLFTSHRALKEAAQLLTERGVPWPLLVQGEAPRGRLLERFRELGNAVLLGTGSFWEGVDVRGEALSCVIIDKLPFASPGDPVLQARIDALRARGGNPFMAYQLPQAVITLKQGVGRLIRDVDDRGVLMVCDPRLLRKSYGYTFLNSLPNMARTRIIDDVRRFFGREIEAEPEA